MSQRLFVAADVTLRFLNAMYSMHSMYSMSSCASCTPCNHALCAHEMCMPLCAWKAHLSYIRWGASPSSFITLERCHSGMAGHRSWLESFWFSATVTLHGQQRNHDTTALAMCFGACRCYSCNQMVGCAGLRTFRATKPCCPVLLGGWSGVR